MCVGRWGVLTTLNRMRNLKEKMQERIKFKEHKIARETR